MGKHKLSVAPGGRTSVSGYLNGNPVTINFAETTSDLLVELVKRQLANSYLNKPEGSKNTSLIDCDNHT